MTQPPERGTPPKLVPGEPLWGTSRISRPGDSPGPSPQPGQPPRVAGTARPVSPTTAPDQPAEPSPGPVRFGETPPAGPPPAGGGYGQGTTYGSGTTYRPGSGHGPGSAHGKGNARLRPASTPHGDGRRPDGRRTGEKSSNPLLIVTALVCFLCGAAAGFAAGLLLT